MGYRLNRLDEPVFMAGLKPMRTEFGIHHRLESCVPIQSVKRAMTKLTSTYSRLLGANLWRLIKVLDSKRRVEFLAIP